MVFVKKKFIHRQLLKLEREMKGRFVGSLEGMRMRRSEKESSLLSSDDDVNKGKTARNR
jgi:hypothetical protein